MGAPVCCSLIFFFVERIEIIYSCMHTHTWFGHFIYSVLLIDNLTTWLSEETPGQP